VGDDLQLRRARPDEAGALTALVVRSKAFWGYDAAFMAAAAPELRVDPGHAAAGWVTVAERGGVPVGVAVLRPDLDPPELEALFVDPAAIGTGAGRALLAAACAQAAAAGLPELVVESDPNAEPFYRAQGAVPAGERVSPSSGRALPLLRLRTAP
jgi:GNAT superfamily N-acetyltransferase